MPMPDSGYSSRDPRMFDVPSRLMQAKKIARVLGHFAAHEAQASRRTALLSVTVADLRALDLGCSSGIVTRALAARWNWGMTAGVDVDRAALAAAVASARRAADGPSGQSPARSRDAVACFAAARGESLPFPAAAFHIAVCNQVYQYVSDVGALLAEIARVLKPRGICYFGARNLWGVLSPQNWAPLLAALFPALVPRGEWAHRAGTPWSYRRLRAAAERHFAVHDYTARVLSDPALSDLFTPVRVPRPLAALLVPVLPTHIWVLQKPSDQ